jgi:hypothetical protein
MHGSISSAVQIERQAVSEAFTPSPITAMEIQVSHKAYPASHTQKIVLSWDLSVF